MPGIFSCFSGLRRHGSYKVWDGIPSMTSLQQMDRLTILRTLDLCVIFSPDSTVMSCCHYLKHSRDLTLEQKLAVIETLLTIVRNQHVDTKTLLLISKTIIKILQQPVSQLSDLEITACRVLIELAVWFPNLALKNVMKLFSIETLPHAAVAWCLHQLIKCHTTKMGADLKYILTKFLPVMERTKNFIHRLWFSRVFEILTMSFAQTTEKELIPQFLKGYFVCKAYIDAPCSCTKEEYRIREQVLLTQGHMANLLPPDQLELELSRVSKEIFSLQSSMPLERTFSLIKPLEQFIQAGVMKDCQKVVHPEMFVFLHTVIATRAPQSNITLATQQIAKHLLLLLHEIQRDNFRWVLCNRIIHEDY
ncbi:uncharacterized protein [Ambystoma mexicanum]|uniref:uncharacterized protein n=1 Tax=Ambystoma mexicanum TaxID=8296 RepID=UPI0037E756AC